MGIVIYPRENWNWVPYLIVGLAMGILISWSAPNNQSILSDVMSNKVFPTAIALEFAFEGTASAFSMMSIGSIATGVFNIENIGCYPYERPEVQNQIIEGLG